MANTNCKQVTTPVTDNTPLDCPIFVLDKCVILPEGSAFLLTDDEGSLEEYHIALEEKLILMNNTISTKENNLGNPPVNGYILSSTTAGVRSWVPNAAASGGHIIQDEGSNLPQRTYLDFVGTGVAVTDSFGTDTTTVTISSGGLNSIEEDTSPTLGGNLDRNGYQISGMVIGTDIQAYSAILQNTTASFTGTLLTKLNSIEANAKDDQAASEVPFTPYLTITSSNVQTAIQELKDEVDGVSGGGISDGDKGDITVSGGGTTWTLDNNAVSTSKISDGAVTNSKVAANGLLFDRLEEISQSTLLGRAAGSGTGDVSQLTAAQVRTIINVENGATGDQNASEVPITDAGTYFSSGNVEGALQEIGLLISDGDKGDISITGGVWNIDANVVDNTNLSTVATSTIKGRITAGTGNVEDLTAAQVRTLINVENGATADQSASEVPLADSGGYFTTDNVEAALQQLAAFSQLDSSGFSGNLATTDDTIQEIANKVDALVLGGNVSKVGTPVNNQIGIWTGDGTIEGDSDITWDGTSFSVTGNITVSGTVDGRDVAADGDIIDIVVVSDVTGVTGANAVTNIISLTQSEYDAIVSPDASTFYVITDPTYEYLQFAISDMTTDITTGNGKAFLPIPFDCNIVSATIDLYTATTGSGMTVDLENNTSTIFSTLLTVDTGETTSRTAATPAVISSASASAGDRLVANVDVVGTGATGGVITLEVERL